MNCANHPDVPVAAYCRTCGKALCENCKRDVKGVIYCEDCIAARVQGTMPAAAPVATAPAVGFAPSPGLAAVLAAVFPFGIGPVYNRQYWKGLVYMLTFAFLVFGASNGRGLEPLFGIGIAFFYFYQIVDSVRTARALQLGQTPPDPLGLNRLFGTTEQKTNWSAGVPVGAVILIGLGCIFLLNNLGWFHFHGLEDWWPMVLIALGVGLFVKRTSACPCIRCRCRVVMGPAILVTLGVLFLLNTLNVYDFGATWPFLLIVIGIVKVLQTSGPTTGHIDNIAENPTAPTGPALTEGGQNSHTEVSNV